MTSTSTNSIVIEDRGDFLMPNYCVVCGLPTLRRVEYVQDNVPIVAPVLGVVRTTQVSCPYCEADAARFLRRFERLRLMQGVGGAFLLLAVVASFFSQLLACIIGIPAFLFLVVTIFAIKPFLYDVFIQCRGKGMKIRGGCPAFREQVLAANPGNSK